jgi:hypothetical protein
MHSHQCDTLAMFNAMTRVNNGEWSFARAAELLTRMTMRDDAMEHLTNRQLRRLENCLEHHAKGCAKNLQSLFDAFQTEIEEGGLKVDRSFYEE